LADPPGRSYAAREGRSKTIVGLHEGWAVFASAVISLWGEENWDRMTLLVRVEK